MAEMEGFEPPDGLTRQLISSQPRYDHFDTSPYFAYYTELPPKNQDMPGDSLPDFSRFGRAY